MRFTCKLYKAKDADEYEYAKTTGTSCGNCLRWDGKRCRDEAELLGEWEKEHGAYERMMRTNRGARIE